MSGPTLLAPGGSADLAPDPADLDGRAVTTLRLLAADGVEAAGSGHPGLPMGAAPVAWVLWSRFLRHDPAEAAWPDRDRFVLSAGHGSMLLYALLHLFGYDLPLEQLRRFRQWGSATPGHPEHGHTPGVEATTGPLGQGIGNAVGMALAERMLAARANTDRHTVVDHRTWVLAGDGDLMEGISHEAASLAGHLGLGRLNVVFDDNDVTIDGPASASCRDDVLARFAAYGWHTLRVAEGADLADIEAALAAAAAQTDRPSLIAVRSTIGHGAPTLAGRSAAHGAPLGPAELAATKARFGWPEQPFHIPPDVAEHARASAGRGAAARQRWLREHERWRAEEPERAATWDLSATPPPPPAELDAVLPTFPAGGSMATRKASGAVLAAVGAAYPALVGGSADLAGSTNTALPATSTVSATDYSGRQVPFGIREHGMGAVLNGIALHGGLRAFGSTFLVFSDYLRPAIRMSALMRLPVVYVFTHDSVAVGEDGPTHQPIEQVESLRLIPGLTVLRPADANETVACWRIALATTTGPTALVLSRQDLPVLDPPDPAGLAGTGHRVVRAQPDPDLLLVAAGSEVAAADATASALAEHGVSAAVLSVPWRERWEQALRARVASPAGEDPVPVASLPDVPALWVEAGVPNGWFALARPADAVIGLRRFGASAPGPLVYARLGFGTDRLVEAALDLLGRTPAPTLGRTPAPTPGRTPAPTPTDPREPE